MALKNLFDMVKADRYTADGREALIKAQEAETEDKVYQIGEISQKTGLQKTANGWVKPKSGKQPGAKNPAESKPEAEGWEETRMASGKIYDLKSQGKRIIEQYDPETETKTFKLRDLNNSHTPDKEFKSLEEAKTAATKSEESKPVEETKTETAAKFETEQEKAKYEEGKKGWETVSKERLPDIKKKVEQKIDYYKKYDPYAMLGKRTGLNAAQKKAVEQNMAQAKENLAFYTGQLEGINEQMGASDSAPRTLTGDTKIHVRKA